MVLEPLINNPILLMMTTVEAPMKHQTRLRNKNKMKEIVTLTLQVSLSHHHNSPMTVGEDNACENAQPADQNANNDDDDAFENDPCPGDLSCCPDAINYDKTA